MQSTKNLDDLANLWNKTKDSKYKDLWYKKVKEWANGSNNTKRRIISVVPVTKQMTEHMSLLVKVDCFELCEILRLHLSTYHDAPFNVHVMKDGSGDFIGCICN